MELTKKILNIAIAFGITTLSLSALIYTVKDNKAAAAPANALKKDMIGVVVMGNSIVAVSYDGNYYHTETLNPANTN